MSDNRQIGHHILNASSNLLGISFLVITSLRAFHLSDDTLIDELTAVSAVLFLASTILSYFSLRTAGLRGVRLEGLADVAFIAGIASLTVSALMLMFGIIH